MNYLNNHILEKERYLAEQERQGFDTSYSRNEWFPVKPAAKSSFIGEQCTMTIAGIDTYPERQFVIERFGIERGCLHLICGTGWSGKSMFAQLMGVCVSAGVDLFASPVARGKVVHIDQEQSKSLTQRRYERMANGLGVRSLDIVRVTLAACIDAIPAKQAEDELTRLLSGVTLCTIDSLAAISQTDENTTEIRTPLDLLRRVAEKTGCAIVLIHHKGKNASGSKQSGRGSSAIYDAVDVQLDLDAAEGVITVSCAKLRDGKQFEPASFTLRDSGAWHSNVRCTERLEFVPTQEVTLRERITRAVSEHELKMGDLRTVVGGNIQTFTDTVHEMVKEGILTMRTGAKNSKWVRLHSERSE